MSLFFSSFFFFPVCIPEGNSCRYSLQEKYSDPFIFSAHLYVVVVMVVEMQDYTTPEAITESEEVCYEHVSSHDMKASIQSPSNKASSMDKLFSILWRPNPIDDTLLV
jgi:hypothetical protein